MHKLCQFSPRGMASGGNGRIFSSGTLLLPPAEIFAAAANPSRPKSRKIRHSKAETNGKSGKIGGEYSLFPVPTIIIYHGG